MNCTGGGRSCLLEIGENSDFFIGCVPWCLQMIVNRMRMRVRLNEQRLAEMLRCARTHTPHLPPDVAPKACAPAAAYEARFSLARASHHLRI